MSLWTKFGVDVSRWQGCELCNPPSEPIGWASLADQGVLYAGIRASIGDYYIDPAFRYNYDGAVAEGIIPVPYYVIAPRNVLDGYDVQPENTVANYLEALDGRKTWFEVADVELVGGAPSASRSGGACSTTPCGTLRQRPMPNK